MSKNCCTPVERASINQESCPLPTLVGKAEQAMASQTDFCPTCGQKGKRVDGITLKAMLDTSLGVLHDVLYLFCRTATCPVVYFSADGRQHFTKDQIRVPVHQKEPSDESVLVCYCFYHSPATLRAELLATGATTVIEEIEAGIKAGQCACDIRNPQGSCCLGNVSAVVKQMSEAM